MLICQTHLKANIPLYLFMNGVKPNFTPSGSRKLQGFQSVGFHSVSGERGVSGESCVFSDFLVFGGSRSTQPTGLLPSDQSSDLICREWHRKSTKLTPMVQFSNRTHSPTCVTFTSKSPITRASIGNPYFPYHAASGYTAAKPPPQSMLTVRQHQQSLSPSPHRRRFALLNLWIPE